MADDQLTEALRQALQSGDVELQQAIIAMMDKPEDRGALNAIRHGLQQGATFGFADEASAAARAGILDPIAGAISEIIPGGMDWETHMGDSTLGERYRMYRDDERDQIAAGREHHGKKMLAAEFVPGLAQAGVGLLGRGAAQMGLREGLDQLAQRTLGQNMRSGALAGLGYGAVGGLGYSEADNVPDMLLDVGIGAGMGAGIGGLTPAAFSGAQRLYQSTLGRFTRQGQDPTQGAVDAATIRAQRELDEALIRDRLTPEELVRRYGDDPDAMLMDLGPHVRQLAKLTARQVGEGGERIVQNVTRRQQQTPQRIAPGTRDFIRRAFRDEDAYIPENFARHERQIMERGKQMADEQGLWELAYRADYQRPRALQNFLRRNQDGVIVNDDARAAYNAARRNLQKRIDVGEVDPNDPAMLARFDEQVLRSLKGNIKLAEIPTSVNARVSDDIRLDLKEHRQLLDAFADAMPEEWSKARQLWAGTMENREAYELGELVMTTKIDDLALLMDEMSTSEIDNFLVGALRKIEHELSRKGDTTDILRTLRSTEHGRRVMRMLAGDERVFQDFLDQALLEQNYLTTFRKVTGGSDTFENIMGQAGTAEAATLGGEVGTLLGIGAQNNSRLLRGVAGIPLIGRSLGRRLGETLSRRDELKRNALADMLLSRDPNQLQRLLQRPPMPGAPLGTAAGVAAASQAPGTISSDMVMDYAQQQLQGLLGD